MPHPNSSPAARVWRYRAGMLAAKVNFHHWLARLIPMLFVLFVLLALLEIFRRETGLPARWSEAFFLFGFGLVAGAAWWRARAHFCSANQALVRLETVLGLHNRLSSAQDGVLPWPAPGATTPDFYQPNWKQIVPPFLAGALFLWSAHLVPVHRVKLGANAEPISAPPEFAQVQNWIDKLKAEDVIEPAKLAEMQTSLDQLRERPAQDWYTQGNLEAANSLKELTEQSMNSLAQDVDQADHAVQSMQEKAQGASDAGSLQPMQDELRKAGQNLASGNLPLKRELLDQLHGAESVTDKSLSAKQLQALHERLQKAKMAAQTARQTHGGFSEEMEQAMAGAAGHGGGHRKMVPGPGGLGGGKETAPLELQPRDKITNPGAFTSVDNEDMSRVTLGDTLKVTSGAHTVDPTAYHGVENAGTAHVEGSGGEAVWRSTYDPQEADTLDQFFK